MIVLLMASAGLVVLSAPSYAQNGDDVVLPPSETCVDTLCVRIEPTEKVGNLTLPVTAPEKDLAVTLEVGYLRAEVSGEHVESVLTWGRVNQEPDPGVLDQEIGPASLTYTHEADVCYQGECTFALGADVDPEAETIGELWRARIRVSLGPLELVDGPSAALIAFVPPVSEPGPEDLPPELNCAGYEDWDRVLLKLAEDTDCDRYPNEREIEEGCDPLDPTAHPGNPDQCNEPPTDGDVQRWIMDFVPDGMNCSGSESITNWANQIVSNPDCTDNELVDQLLALCNPFNPASTPVSPSPNACLPEPDPDNPDSWATQSFAWLSEQVDWFYDALTAPIPPWLFGILQWLEDRLAEQPEP